MTRRSGFGRRDLALLFGLALPGCAGGATEAQAQQGNRRQPQRNADRVVVRLPQMPCPDRAGDIAGLVLEGSGAPAGTVTVFGHAFRPGDLPRGAGLAARLAGDGRALPVQIDVSRRHPDGSARFGVVALAAPALPAGQRAGVVLSRRDGPAPAAAPLDFATALQGREITIELTPTGGGAPWRADLGALLRAGQTSAPWQSGPLATQARLMLPAPLGAVRSLRCVADVAVRGDGTVWVDLWLRNDIAMQRGGDDVAYAMRLSVDGRAALAADVPRHWQYGAWGRLVGAARGGATAPPPPRVIHDARYLAAAGAIMPYDLSVGVGERVFEDIERATSRSDWDAPLDPRGLQTSMGAPGARPDLGQTTNWIAAWVTSGDARAEAFAVGQAEASGGIPWHFWDPTGGADGKGGWMDVKRWPRFWWDQRGGQPPYTLVRPVPITVWQRGATPSHQPALNFVPYLLTGRRPFLDNLLAQGAWNVVTVWPAARRSDGPENDMLVMKNRQTRSAAWTMRQLTEASWIAPEDDPNRAYLEEVTTLNWKWVRDQLPEWTRVQGGVHGWLGQRNLGYALNLSPWQHDYFASTAAMAALRGQEDARAVLDWMRNFLVGRFFATDQGFPRNDGVAYQIAIMAEPRPSNDEPPKTPFHTWREVAETTRERGLSNGDGWKRSNGEYPRLGMLSLALIGHVFNDPRAKEAWEWLAASNMPYTRLTVFQRFPYHTVAPPGLARVPEQAPRCAPSARR